MPLQGNWNLISPASLKSHILQIVFSIFKNERKTNSCSSLRYNKFERVDSQCEKARAKNHLNFKSQVETFPTTSPLSYQFMLKLSLEKKQASTLTNNVSSHSSRWNFLRRRPLASRRLSRCARASRSPSAQRWVKFSTRCNKCNIKCTTVNRIFNSTTRCNWTRQEFII